MASPRSDMQQGIGTLLRDLADGSARLVRDEVQLARLETTALVKAVGQGTASVAAGGVLALLGTLALFTGVVLLPGDQWLKDQYWLAALIVTAVAGGLAAWFAKQGLDLLTPRRLVPDQTVETLKEDKEWLKRQLTSGGTSR
jgi:hypothetical protein